MTAPVIPNVGTGWRGVANLMAWPFYLQKEHQHPLGGHQSWNGRIGEKKNLVPNQIQTPDHPTCSTSLIQNKVQALILIKSTSDTSASIWMTFPLFSSLS